jgi:hypothetical protein
MAKFLRLRTAPGQYSALRGGMRKYAGLPGVGGRSRRIRRFRHSPFGTSGRRVSEQIRPYLSSFPYSTGGIQCKYLISVGLSVSLIQCRLSGNLIDFFDCFLVFLAGCQAGFLQSIELCLVFGWLIRGILAQCLCPNKFDLKIEQTQSFPRPLALCSLPGGIFANFSRKSKNFTKKIKKIQMQIWLIFAKMSSKKIILMGN